MARRRQDPKVEALRAERSLNPRPEAVTDEEFASSEFFDARDLVQVKYEMVRRVRVEGDAVSRSAAAFGFSRPSFYEAANALEASGLAGLVPARPGPRRAHKLTEEVVAFVRQRLEADPSLRSVDLVEVIAGRFGLRVHPRSVERALARGACLVSVHVSLRSGRRPALALRPARGRALAQAQGRGSDSRGVARPATPAYQRRAISLMSKF